MNYTKLWLLVLIRSCVVLVLSIQLRILNADIFTKPLIWGVSRLFVDLVIPSNSNLTTYIDKCHLCVHLNHSLCYCYDERLSDVDVILPLNCMTELPVWFSLQLVDCTAEGSKSSEYFTTAIYLPTNREDMTDIDKDIVSKLTLILPLHLDDIARSLLLLRSMERSSFNNSNIFELLIFVPDYQVDIVTRVVYGFTSLWDFPVTVHPQSILFRDPSVLHATYPYAIQMAIKILAAKLVRTNFYMTLDADVVQLTPILTNAIWQYENRAIYEHEPRGEVHPLWWEGSENILGIRHPYPQRMPDFGPATQGFGVTPAILSTAGSLLVVKTIMDGFCGSVDDERICDVEVAERRWLTGFGHNNVLWSEVRVYNSLLIRVDSKFHT